MSITDELREYTEKQIKWLDMTKVHYRKLLAIADRIDAEHEMATSEFWAKINAVPATDENMAEHGWVRLPVDANGEYIHIGDMMVSKDGKVHRVDSLTRNPTWFDYEWSIRLALLNDGVGAGSLVRYRPDTLRHYHAPTVEDVLDEFANRLYEKAAYFDEEHVQKAITEYASKLRLAGDDE